MSKKKIQACAVAAIFGGACAATFAQSSVAVYGLVDMGVGQFAGTPSGVNASSSRVTKVDSGLMSTSHLGFRGVEDLGSGSSASFDLSAFLRADAGAPGRSDAIGPPVNVAADPVFSRASWVGLGNSRLGRVRFGNAGTLLFVNSIISNAFGDSTVLSPINLVTFIGSPLSGGTVWSNQVVYDSPNWNGWGTSAAYAFSEGQGGGNAAWRASYARGPLAAGLTWQSVKRNPASFADGTSANDTKAWQLATSYDFGWMKLFGHLGRIDNRGTEATPLAISYRVWSLSADIPAGPGSVLVGYADRSTSDAVGPLPATSAGGNKEREVLTVAYQYRVSKRTDVYAAALNDRTRTVTQPAPGRIVDVRATSWGVGIRHRF